MQRRVPVLQVLVLFALVLYVGAKDGDYTWGDLWAPILLQASFLGIAAAGQTLAILVGGLDFSIAAYIVAGNLLTTHLTGLEHWNFAASALIVLADLPGSAADCPGGRATASALSPSSSRSG